MKEAERRSNKNILALPGDMMETKQQLLFQKQQAMFMQNFTEIKRLHLIARMNNIDIGDE